MPSTLAESIRRKISQDQTAKNAKAVGAEVDISSAFKAFAQEFVSLIDTIKRGTLPSCVNIRAASEKLLTALATLPAQPATIELRDFLLQDLSAFLAELERAIQLPQESSTTAILEQFEKVKQSFEKSRVKEGSPAFWESSI